MREIKDELASWNFASEFSQTSDLAKILEECELLTDKVNTLILRKLCLEKVSF